MKPKTYTLLTLILCASSLLQATHTHLSDNIAERAQRLFATVDPIEFNITQQTDPQNLIRSITTLEYALAENRTSYQLERNALNAFYMGVTQELKMILLESIQPSDTHEKTLSKVRAERAHINRVFSSPQKAPFLAYPLAKASLAIIDALSNTPIPRATQKEIITHFRSDIHSALIENQLPPSDIFAPDDVCYLEKIFTSFLSYHGESWTPTPDSIYTWTCRGLKVAASVIAIGGGFYLGKQVYNNLESTNSVVENLNQTIDDLHALLAANNNTKEDTETDSGEEKETATIPELLGEITQTLKVLQQAGGDVEQYLQEGGRVDIILKDIESFLREGGKIDGILHNIRETIAHPIYGGNFMTNSWSPLSSRDFTEINISVDDEREPSLDTTKDNNIDLSSSMNSSQVFISPQPQNAPEAGYWILNYIPFYNNQT